MDGKEAIGIAVFQRPGSNALATAESVPEVVNPVSDVSVPAIDELPDTAMPPEATDRPPLETVNPSETNAEP